MNDEDGVPHVTTCPIKQLHKRDKGYFSNCGAVWWDINDVKDAKDSPFIATIKTLFANNIDFDNLPTPKGYEIIELKFKPLEYNIIADDE